VGESQSPLLRKHGNFPYRHGRNHGAAGETFQLRSPRIPGGPVDWHEQGGRTPVAADHHADFLPLNPRDNTQTLGLELGDRHFHVLTTV
jgi:hypothetical protein